MFSRGYPHARGMSKHRAPWPGRGQTACHVSFRNRSYWIPGSYAPALSEKRNSFLRLLKNKGFKKESMTKVGLYAISKSTTLESNKSLLAKHTIAELQNNEEVRRQYLAL